MTTLREAAEAALEALEYINKYGFVLADYEGPMEQAITALRAALSAEHGEQEPVAVCEYCEKERPVTHPPRREWRGLTEEEKLQILDDTMEGGDLMDIARAIEAALKEKNHE